MKISSLLTLSFSVLCGVTAFAQTASQTLAASPAGSPAAKPSAKPAAKPSGSSTAPAPRDLKWLARHNGFVAEAKKGGIDILFLGDSITDYWRDRGKAVWDEMYAPRKAANFGIGGDRTQNVLWRIERGELDGVKPQVIVLMIGTNNTSTDSVDQVVAGVEAVVTEIRKRCPDSKLLLLAIFPRNKPKEEYRTEKTLLVNARLAKLDDGKSIRFLDIGSKFLGPDGKVPADIMPDFLHPNAKGYRIWADAMEPTLKEMLKDTGTSSGSSTP